MTRGSNPPTYNARLFGSGAARRENGPALPGEIIPLLSPLPPIGEVIAVGMGLVFWGMWSGGGGMWAGLPEAFCPFS